MSETPRDKDQEKGDEVLRRLLKTPPDPKAKPQTKKRQAEACRPPLEQPSRKKGE